MIKVGIIGLGPVWETRYRPALERLRERLAVCAVYDPVAGRAEQVADELRAVPCYGVAALLEGHALDAVLLLDRSWHGDYPLRLLLEKRKPAYLAGSFGSEVERLRELHEAADAAGLTLMPEFSRRYTPATERLQELMATRLGRPRRITIEATAPEPDDVAAVPGQKTGFDLLVGLLDWCRYVVRMAPVSIECRPLEPAAGTGTEDVAVVAEFQQPRGAGERPVAELRIHGRPSNPEPASAPAASHPCHQIVCERGSAGIDSTVAITWTCEDGPVAESLASERSEVEVMLDHFCRRIVGGLIPVADIADVCRAVSLAQAAEESLRSGRRIEVEILK